MGVEMIDDIIRQVKDGLTGRYADAGNASSTLLKVVELAGDGNYLEFGVLHGGSLCAVALYKKALGHSGVCVGVDLFDGWYYERTNTLLDKSGVPVILDTVEANIRSFELKNVVLVKSKTQDFETKMKFAVAFIDAGHSFKGAWHDWLKVKEITTRFVVFHDYMLIEGVTKAGNQASRNSGWSIYEKRPGVLVLEKIDES
jgi:hypothetical protein